MVLPNGLLTSLRRALVSASRWKIEPHTRNRAFAKAVAAADRAREERDWAAAADGYEAALGIKADDPAIWVQLGNMAKDSKDYPRARRAYETALALAPDEADTHIQFGHLLKLVGENDRALKSYQQALQINPKNVDAIRELYALGAGLPSSQSFASRRGAGSARKLPLNARIVSARAMLDELVRSGSEDATALTKGREALRQAAPAIGDAVQALDGLLKTINGLTAQAAGADRDGDAMAAAAVEIVFDVSDLIQYFRLHRLPTGIQRVQIEVISVALLKATRMLRVRICCFTEAADYWRNVPAEDFLTLCELSLLDQDWTAPEWVELVTALDERMHGAPDFVFGTGAFLVNIGTSWWLQNYFLHVREAKRRHGVLYVPFVHDMIPIMTPEYCVEGLVQDFISWAQGVYLYADYFFVNSNATKTDLMQVGATLGHAVDDSRVHVVRLDADYRKPGGPTEDVSDVLGEAHVGPGGFVLFVSTIEARKNHAAVFDAWLRLIKDYGEARVPKLICVGARGWLNDAVFARLAASRLLRDKVVILSGVRDADLALLYRECLFSVYPSFYEGWGLPVTESLCYGKTALVSRSSSLPEAGGDFVDYFEIGNETDLVDGLRTMMFDADHRGRKEEHVRSHFQARSWESISDDIEKALHDWRDGPPRPPQSVDPIMLGRYYPMARNSEIRVTRGMQSGEGYRLGNSWWGPGEWGCWLKPKAARIAFKLDDGPGAYRLYIGLQAPPATDVPYVVSETGGPAARGLLKAGRSRWVAIDLGATVPGQAVTIILQGAAQQSLKLRDGQDAVPVSLGVIGIMVCRADDHTARSGLTEAVALDTLDDFARAWSAPDGFEPPAADSI